MLQVFHGFSKNSQEELQDTTNSEGAETRDDATDLNVTFPFIYSGSNDMV